MWASRSNPGTSSTSRTPRPTSSEARCRSGNSCSEWLARLSDHIPDPGLHRTLFYGEYSNRVRGCGEPAEPAAEAGEEHKQRRRAPPSWGRLIAKVYQVAPLVCAGCGKHMSVVAFVTDSAAIGRILEHLGLSNPEAEKPPPPLREMLRVAEHGDVWGVPQEWD